jgi:DNA repair protein RadC
MKYTLHEVRISRLREIQVDNPELTSPQAVADFYRENVTQAVWWDADIETLVVLLLNARKRIIGFSLVASGTIDSCFAHPREIFKTAIVQGAVAIALCHNHPSGDPTPSEADIKITRDIIRAGQLLKIELLDHIIIGDKTDTKPGYTSLREAGYFYV